MACSFFAEVKGDAARDKACCPCVDAPMAMTFWIGFFARIRELRFPIQNASWAANERREAAVLIWVTQLKTHENSVRIVG
jgi:hypothetical protein